MMSIRLSIIINVCFLVSLIESRKSLRDYVVSQNYFAGEELLVYDRTQENLLCEIESSNYLFNRLTNLISYPSHQTIGSIRNVWLSSMYQGYMNVLDDQLNKWVKGQIYQRYRPEGFRFIIEYGGQSYIMENKLGSLITEIRNQKRPTILLTKFSQTYFNPLFGSSRYNIEVYGNDLPDPIYILALHALDSTTLKRRIKFLP